MNLKGIAYKDLRVSIGYQRAIEKAEAQWYMGLPPVTIFCVQLLTQELTTPFGVFHEAAERALERPVFSHEFARPDSLYAELVMGKNTPMYDDIVPHLS